MAQGTWKFISHPFDGDLINGRLLVRSLDYFSALELLTGDNIIGDKLEAGSEMYLRDTLETETATPEMIERMGQLGFQIAPGAKWKISGITVKEPYRHTFIYCLTEGDFDAQAKIFGYDRAVEVFDPKGLARAIYEEGVLVHDNTVSVRSIFSDFDCRPVSYVEKRVAIEDMVNPAGGAYNKPKMYSDQKELRLAFHAIEPSLHDDLLIQIPNPSRFLRAAARPKVEPALAPMPVENQRTVLEEIDDLLSEINAYDAETEAITKPFQDRKSAIWDDAVARMGREAASRDPDVRAARDPLSAEMMEIYQSRSVASHERFQRKVLALMWRARREDGIRPVGIASRANDKMALGFLRERYAASSWPSPASMYIQNTVHFFGDRPAPPLTWDRDIMGLLPHEHR